MTTKGLGCPGLDSAIYVHSLAICRAAPPAFLEYILEGFSDTT
jgi:hypothetical protein